MMSSCEKKSNGGTSEDSETLGTLEIVGGALPGKFSISETKKVQFSQGNLQYLGETGTWRFAEHQYDFVGDANKNISTMCKNWIDLFGWGTGSNPTKTDTDYKKYSYFSEWGNNPISNGGNKANQWRTLEDYEWEYLLNTRKEAKSLRGQAKVNNIKGYILLPDGFVFPKGIDFEADAKSSTYNEYTLNQWTKLEIAGAVFFPCGGRRYQTEVENHSGLCTYWTATPRIVSGTVNGEATAYDVAFSNQKITNSLRTYGLSVRLVQDVK